MRWCAWPVKTAREELEELGVRSQLFFHVQGAFGLLERLWGYGFDF
jgi:hypothetical protein